VALQREIAGQHDVVMDGRDIGTHVLPGAAVKIFVTASVQARARRRQLELAAKGIEKGLPDCVSDIEERDRQDSSRVASPLRVAEGAQVLDTTGMTAEDAVEFVIRRVEQAL
jgi:cytidylate kinase